MPDLTQKNMIEMVRLIRLNDEANRQYHAEMLGIEAVLRLLLSMCPMFYGKTWYDRLE